MLACGASLLLDLVCMLLDSRAAWLVLSHMSVLQSVAASIGMLVDTLQVRQQLHVVMISCMRCSGGPRLLRSSPPSAFWIKLIGMHGKSNNVSLGIPVADMSDAGLLQLHTTVVNSKNHC